MLAAILLFTVCIAANVLVFALVSAVLFDPLPGYRDAGRLVQLWSMRAGENQYPFSSAEYVDYATRSQTLAQIAPFSMQAANLKTPKGSARFMGARVSASFFEVTGIRVALGRVLLPADESPESARMVVIGPRIWQRLFQADPKTAGRVLTLNSEQYIVAGVLPQDFTLAEAGPDFLLPLPPLGKGVQHKSANYLHLLGRLKPGVTLDQAQAELNVIAACLKAEFPNANPEKTGVRLVPLREAMFGQTRLRLLTLLGAVAAVLLIAAINMAGALSVRSWEWRRDFALLAAMGTNPARLLRQFLLQTCAAGLVAGIAACALAAWQLRYLDSILPVTVPMRALHPSILTAPVLLFALAISTACGLIFGLPAAIHAAYVKGPRIFPVSLAGSARAGDSGKRLLVIAQVAACLVLVIGTGLLSRSLLRLELVKPGFNPDNLLTFRISPPQSRIHDAGYTVALHDRLLGRLQGAPLISAGAAFALPLAKNYATVDLSLAGEPRERVLAVPYLFVGETYFDAMQIPIMWGRGFSLHDNMGSQPAAIVSQALADRLGRSHNCIGTHVEIDDANGEPRDVEVVGVAGDVHQKKLGDEHAETLYVPLRQVPPAAAEFFNLSLSWVVRTQDAPMDAAAAVRQRISPVVGDSVASEFIPMANVVQRQLVGERRNVWMAAAFAAAILVLAAIALYTLISHFVYRHAREIGVRMVLGACSRQILWHVIGEGLSLTITGAIFGLGAIFVLARLLSTMLFEVPVFDPLTIGGATLLLLLVAVLAATLPAVRATKVDPILTLRRE